MDTISLETITDITLHQFGDTMLTDDKEKGRLP